MTFVERLEDRLLSNPRADRVRDVAALTGRSTRSKRGLFRAEGPQNVREAVRCALDPHGDPALPALDAVYVTRQALERHPEIAADLETLDGRGGVFLRAVTPEVLGAMTDAVSPQGMLAVCRVPDTDVTALTATDLLCVLVRVQDPGNAGTVIRAADAAGAGAVVLTSGSVDPFNPKAVRSTAGSLFHLPVLTGVDLPDLAASARDRGLRLLAADGRAEVSVDELADAALLRWADLPPSGGAAPRADPGEGFAVAARPPRLEDPTAWLFGNEAQGLSDDERALADLAVAVPLHGRAESLNVGTAATVCLYASARAQRRRAGETTAARESAGGVVPANGATA
ncbi:RNA methyltransferase [Kocuria sp.]|uniref:TrmH family RNA methyltransferase n=1 Tax=Kocuria sp. TaxID=1871328 RepID=UPI0026DB2EED|nr:RNA methyltransferase [Kocuria sp.]MDO4919523.1 RNA methyltransferase [Kocuria sp.]